MTLIFTNVNEIPHDPSSTLIDFLSLKIKGILKLSFGLYPQVGYIVIVLSFRTENRINIDQNYRSGDVC